MFELRSFSCLAYTDENLLEFLHDQRELEEIVLAHSYVEFGRPVQWKFPNHRTFDGPMSWADAIVPHRSVSHVVICHNITGGQITSLGLTAAPISSLQITAHAMCRKPLADLKTLFPALKNLTLTMGVNWPTQLNGFRIFLDGSGIFLSTIESFGLLAYYRDDVQFINEVTARAPAVRRFSLHYCKHVGMENRLVCWTKEVNGWEVSE
ncbi:hypothetical protein C8R43DRAFT_657669 [Mycena crocata]|nr:hypothetical protein C8R43DRAFT_657669 [Mycena crocata]